MSKRSRRLLYGLGALIALLGLAAALVKMPWFQRELRRRVVATLEDLTGGRVEMDELHPRPLHFQLIFHGFILRGREQSTQSPLLSARTVTIGFTPASLLSRRFLLRSFGVADAEAHIYRYPDGTTNLPSPWGPSQPGGPLKLLDLAIGRLTLVRTNVFYNDQRLPLDFTARDVTLLLHFGFLGHYSGTVSSPQLTLLRGAWSSPPIEFSSRIDFSGKEMKVTSLDWKTAEASGQGTATVRLVPVFQGDFSIKVQGEASPLARALGFPDVQNGSFKLDIQATYRQGHFRAHGHAQAQRLLVRSSSVQPGTVDLVAEYSLDPHRLVIPNFTLSALGGTTEGRAEISWPDPSPKFTVTGRVRGVEWERARRAFPGMSPLLSRLPLRVQVEGIVEAAWRGKLEGLNSSFNLQFRATREGAGGRAVSGFAEGRATLAPGLVIDLRAAKIQTARSTLTAQGTFRERESGLAFQLRTSDFEEWRPLIEPLAASWAPLPAVLKSTVTFAGTVSGSTSEPVIRGRLRVGAFEYGGWAWDSFEAGLVAAPNLLQLSSGRLVGRNSQLTFDISLGLDHWTLTPEASVHIVARAQRVPLEGLRDVLNLGYPVSGLLACRLDLQGTFSNLEGRGSVRIEQATVAGEAVDSLSSDIHASGPSVYFDNLQLAKGHGRLTGQARVEPTTRAFSAQLHASGFFLGDFRQLAAHRSGSPKLSELQGTASFDLTAEGTPGKVQLQSKLEIPDITFQGKSLGQFSSQLDWHGEQLQLQGQFRGPGGNVSFSGGAHTEGDWPLELTGQYTNFRADPWIHYLRPSELEAAMTASGSFSVKGPLKEPNRLEARTRAENLQVSLPGLIWKNDQPVEMNLANQVVTVSRFQMRGPSTDFQVEGSMKFSPPAALALNARGHAEASLLTLFDPSLKASGRFDANLRATGTPSDPELFGTLQAENVNLGYADVPLRLTELQGEAKLEGERITILSLRGQCGQGSVSLTGSATLLEPHRIDLRADLDQARVVYPLGFSDIVSGSLHLAGTVQSSVLSGDILLKQVLVAGNFDLMAWMAEVATQVTTQPPGLSVPTASKIRLDIGVTSDPVVRLASHNLKAVADVNLRLQGTLAKPVAFGDIHFQSGEAVFRGNRFRLTRGDVALKNPFRTEALLDLEAQTRIEHYDVTLNVTGPLDRVKIGYRSDPPLPSSDVLNLLAFGSAPQEQVLTGGTTRAGSSVSSMGAGALLSEALSSQVSSQVQRIFGISRIRIDPNVGGLAAAGGSRITVEQKVGPDFSITYVTNTSGSQQRIIQFDWDINDRTEVIGERDQNGVYGLELRFHHRFK